ncbi:MAG: hypothetical protein ACTHLZ_16485 [Tepidisphaeraceae bacterium]
MQCRVMQGWVMRSNLVRSGRTRNARTVLAAVAALTMAGGLWSVARADLPQSVRESTSAEQFKDEINKYVADQIDRVKAGDKNSAQAREELARQPESSQTVSPSSSFQTMYVSAVVSNLDGMMSSKSVPLRLNAGIVVARLCQATHAPQLASVAEQLMKDPAPAVALWGVKSASTLIPTIISVPYNLKSQTLTKSVVEAVKQHSKTGAIVQEAYNSVSVGDLNPPLPQPALQACVDAMNGIQALRVEEWKAGIPAAPQADRVPTIFFARGTINRAMTKAEKAEAVQHQLSLLALSSEKAASAAADVKKGLFELASANAGVLKVMLLNDNQSTTATKFNDLIGLPKNLQAPQIAQKIADAEAAVKALPDYSSIKPVASSQASAG